MPNKVLVVDDEPQSRDVIKVALELEGYSIYGVASAEEALEVLKNENFDVMFFDLGLPGMSGIELCEEVRKDNPVAVIYAITGFSEIFELADCRGAGFDDYFTKPVDLRTLIEATRDAFKKISRWEREKG